MARTLTAPEVPARDGASRRGRVLAALDPGTVKVDERTAQDLVESTRELSEKLDYPGPGEETARDWGGFVGSLTPEIVAAFLKDPKRFPEADWPLLYRPHFTLYLAFLRLFGRAQEELNGLSGRHLDFYYRTVLGLKERPPEADHVHLILDLVKGGQSVGSASPSGGPHEVRVPAGTKASAGPDSSGREQVYETDRPVVVNRIQIAERRAVLEHRSG